MISRAVDSRLRSIVDLSGPYVSPTLAEHLRLTACMGHLAGGLDSDASVDGQTEKNKKK